MRNGLPFSKPKVRLYGEPGDAQQYLGAAYNLLFKVRQFCEASGAPVFAMQRTLENGAVVQAAVFGQEESVAAYPPGFTPTVVVDDSKKVLPVQVYHSRLVWKPEGFVITPRSEAAPDGWGLPETEDGLGTPKGPIRQVIINRFKHNKYPDVLFNSMPPKKGMRFFIAPFFYVGEDAFPPDEDGNKAPFEVIGFRDPRITSKTKLKDMPFEEWEEVTYDEVEEVIRKGFVAQMEPKWRERIMEEELEDWFCHRPQATRYLREDEDVDPERCDFHSDLLNDIFTDTNAYRVSQGRHELSPPLRGYYNGLARSVISEMSRSGVMAHNSEEFREGYQRFFERVYRFAQPLDQSGENLIIYPEGNVKSGETLGEAMVKGWISSPGHRANILFNWSGQGLENEAELAGFIELSVGSGTITKAQPPPYTQPATELSQASSGAMASQVFMRADRWVTESVLLWEGDEGSIGIEELIGGTFRYATLNLPVFRHAATISGGVAVRMNGRYINLNEPSERHVLMGAALSRGDEKLYLNAAYYYFPDTQSDPVEFRLLRWDIDKLPTDKDGDDFPEPEEIFDYALPPETYAISRVLFSQNGRKCTFTYHEREAWPNNYLRTDTSDFRSRGTLPITLYGTSLTHVEFNDPYFVTGTKQEVLVDASAGRFAPATSTSNNYYTASCAGSYVIWRDYDENDLFDIVCEGENTVEASVSRVYSHTFGKLVFPKGEFVHTDTTEDVLVERHGSKGFTNLLLHFDARSPEDTVYVRLDPSVEWESAISRESLRLGQVLVFRDEEIKVNADVMVRAEEDLPPYGAWNWQLSSSAKIPSAAPFRILVSGGSIGRYFVAPLHAYFSGSSVRDGLGFAAGDVCMSPHHASLNRRTLGTQTTLKSPYTALSTQEFSFAPYAAFLRSDTVDRTYDFGQPAGPTDYSINGLADAFFVRYRDEYLLGGQFGQVFGLKKHGQQDDDQYFWRSSLDLKEVTGVDDLSDNILPMGVI